MLDELLLLLRLHLRLLSRKGGKGKGGPPRGGAGVLLRPAVLAFVGVAISLGLGRFLSLLVSGTGGISILTPLLSLASTGLTLLLFLFAFPFVLGSFTTNSDLKLLLPTPLSPRLILGEKFLDLYAALALTPLIGGLLLLLVIGSSLSLAPGFYLVGVAALMLLPLAPLAIAVAITVGVLRWIPPARARSVTAILGALLGIAYYLGIQLLNGRAGAAQAVSVQASLARVSHAWWQSLPSVWPGEAMAAAAQGDAGSALLYLVATAVLALAFTALAIGVSARLFATGWATYQETGRRARAASRPAPAPIAPSAAGARAPSVSGESRGRRLPAWWPLLGKEWRTVRRDPQLWAPLLYPLFIGGFGVYNLVARGRAAPAGSPFAVGLLYGVLAVLTTLLAVSLALPLFNREGHSLYLLALMPLSAREILAAKWAAAALPVLILAEVLAAAGAVLLRLAVWQALLGGLAMAALIVALCGVLLLLALDFPRLDWDNPRRQVSTAASLLGMLVGLVLGSVVVGLLVATIALATRLPLLALFTGTGLFALTLLVTMVAATAAPPRLTRLLQGEGR